LEPSEIPAVKEVEESARIQQQEEPEIDLSILPVIAVAMPIENPMVFNTDPKNPMPVAAQKSDAGVEVLGGNGVRKMAANTSKYLKACDINVVRFGNADHFRYRETTVYYQKGYREKASHLKDLLSGYTNHLQMKEQRLEKAPLRLIVGRDLAPFNAFFNKTLKIDIANGNGVRGIARKIGEYLKGQGWTIDRVSDADHFAYDKTIVHYGAGQYPIAQLIAKELSKSCDAQLVKSNRPQITVLLGSDMVY
jgi:hypothetical protein